MECYSHVVRMRKIVAISEKAVNSCTLNFWNKQLTHFRTKKKSYLASLLTGTVHSRPYCSYVTYSTDYYQRITLESWFTNLEQTPLHRCQQLPAPYKRLIADNNKTDKSNRQTDLFD